MQRMHVEAALRAVADLARELVGLLAAGAWEATPAHDLPRLRTDNQLVRVSRSDVWESTRVEVGG